MRWSELGARHLLALRLLLLNGDWATVKSASHGPHRRIADKLSLRFPERAGAAARPWPVRASPPLPKNLRPRLEDARLDALALLRAIDRALIAPHKLPKQELHQLYELDADCAEALWALDQPAAPRLHNDVPRPHVS